MASSDTKAPSANSSTPTPTKPTSKAAGTAAPDWEGVHAVLMATREAIRQAVEERNSGSA